MAPSKTMFNMGGLLIFQISGCSIHNVNSLDPQDTSSIIFGLTTVVLYHPYNSLVSNVDYSNSSIQFFHISGLTPPTLSTIAFGFQNINFHDWHFTSQSTMFTTEGLSYDINVIFSFSNLTYENIEFDTKGILFNLRHQLQSNLTISNSKFKNIKNGYICIESTNKQNTEILTNVVFINSEFDNIEQSSVSLIETEEGSRLFISHCSFSNIFSLSDGSVLTGGYRDTITIISDSTFNNNSAVNGGVINVQDGSVFKWFNWTISDNFAITSGVINVIQNGAFEFYQSFIFNNYAHNNPVSQLFDSPTESIISNTQIHNNVYISTSEIQTEMNSDCSKLCFLNGAFINFINDTVVMNEDDSGESIFQLILSTLKIDNNSSIYNQSLIGKSFVSTLSFEDSTILTLELEDTWLEAFESTITLTNMNISNINDNSIFKGKSFKLIFEKINVLNFIFRREFHQSITE